MFVIIIGLFYEHIEVDGFTKISTSVLYNARIEEFVIWKHVTSLRPSTGNCAAH